MNLRKSRIARPALPMVLSALCHAQQTPSASPSLVTFARQSNTGQIALVERGRALPLLITEGNPQTVFTAAQAFAGDVERVSGASMEILQGLPAHPPQEVIIAGVIGRSVEIDRLRENGKLNTALIEGKWESALTTVETDPMPGVRRALVIAGSDRRGVAFALFALLRKMGVSPWTWWADVPVKIHRAIYLDTAPHLQPGSCNNTTR